MANSLKSYHKKLNFLLNVSIIGCTLFFPLVLILLTIVVVHSKHLDYKTKKEDRIFFRELRKYLNEMK